MLALAVIAIPAQLFASVQISEIYYRPPGTPEPIAEEFIEITNDGNAPCALDGLRFSRGVRYSFPDVTLQPGERFVARPPWVGSLSNSGETLTLISGTGTEIDEVEYAEGGDWAPRTAGELDLGSRGWIWDNAHDGGGSSLERINPEVPNQHGQNWAASLTPGGTPGGVNSVESTDTAPLILGAAHTPPIPTPSESVAITCEVFGSETASVFYRTSDEIVFKSLPLLSFVGSDGGERVAHLPATPDGTIIEAYIEARSASGKIRTIPSNAPDTTLLYQVDGSFDPDTIPSDSPPSYYFIMRPSERAELASIGSNATRSESNAQFNATFVSAEPGRIRVRHQCGVRNRGASSRFPPPNNYLISFPPDDPWDGLAAVKFNAKTPFSQVAGSTLFAALGIETADASPARLIINGVNPATPIEPMYGHYAMVEPFDSRFTENHFPEDPDGNLYQVRDNEDIQDSGELQFEGNDPDEYRDTYFKQTNSSSDDFSDIIALTRNLENESTFEDSADLDQWARFFAADALLGNREGGLTTGKGDDYALYSGETDPRFRLVPHDLDTLGAAGMNVSPTRSLLVYDDVEGLETLFDSPGFIRKYYRALITLLDSSYGASALGQSLDGWTDGTPRQKAIEFMEDRAAYVRSQIPTEFTIARPAQTVDGRYLVDDGSLTFSGNFDATRTASVMIGSTSATISPHDGTWSARLSTLPGESVVGIRTFDESGNAIFEGSVTLWDTRDVGETILEGNLTASTQAAGDPELTAAASASPGVPFFVRIDLTDPSTGLLNRNRWDASATLTTNSPSASISPASIAITNGRGSALLTITGVNNGETLTLSADVEGNSTSRQLTFSTPTPTSVSGTLPGNTTNWSGDITINSDVTVPAGHTLTIAPGTRITLAGDSIPGSTAGADLIVRGELQSNGTTAAPVIFSPATPGTTWGQIRFIDAAPSTFHFTHIHGAGHAPGGGHTGRGRVIRLTNSDVTFEDSTITDCFGKIGETESNSKLTLRNSILSRAVMSFETKDTEILVENCHITDMRGFYREDGIIDDDDAIYLNSTDPSIPIVLRDVVIAGTDDDGVDTLDSTVTLENIIIRDCADKGISGNEGAISATRVLSVDNAIGISVKNETITNISYTTIARSSEFAFQAENKSGSDPPTGATITDSIIVGEVTTDYDEEDIRITRSILSALWDFVGSSGNLVTDPLLASPSGGDFRPIPDSPAIGFAAGGTTAGFHQEPGTTPDSGIITLTPGESPYLVTGDATVLEGSRLVILPGTTIYMEEDAMLTVKGTIQAFGTNQQPILITAPPGADDVPDRAGNGGLPDGPPKSKGIKIVDSMSADNLLTHVVFKHAQDNNGALGIIRSRAIVDRCQFSDTHLRMIFTDDAAVEIANCTFADMFAPGENADELGLDNVSEQIKGTGFIPTSPPGLRYLIQGNTFGTNRGHNDVIDVGSASLPDPIVEIIGNTFAGAGDELIDLNGDAYIEGNLFQNVFKDDETSDRGYANAISTSDFSDDTVYVIRNHFIDIDHAVNLKQGAFAFFEGNTVHMIHPDFDDRFGNPSVASAINFFIPTDFNPTAGGGAFVRRNIFSDLPRIFGNADLPRRSPDTPLVFEENFVDSAIGETAISDRRPGSVLDLGSGNILGTPDLLDSHFGALIPAGATITGGPPTLTASSEATFTIGGAGIARFRWKLNNGAWSEMIPIGNGFVPDSTTIREVPLTVTAVPDGQNQLSVLGTTFAGTEQRSPTTSRLWSVDPTLEPSLELTGIAFTGASPEFTVRNPTNSNIDIEDTALFIDGIEAFEFPEDSIPPGGIRTYPITTTPGDFFDNVFSLQSSAGRLIDSVKVGYIPPGYSLVKDGSWELSVPAAPATDVVISEVFAGGTITLKDDFIELTNPGDRPVDISGLTLVGGRQFTLPPLTYLAPGEYLALDEDITDIDLPAREGHISLVGIDELSYTNLPHDVALLGDGSLTAVPTPDLPPAPPAIIAVFENLRITEINYAGNPSDDFIELTNLGNLSIDISGVRLLDGISAVIPEGTVLAPGASVIVVSDRNRYPTAVAGYSRQLNDSGEEIELRLPLPYRAAILRIAYEESWAPATGSSGLGRTLVFTGDTRAPVAWGRSTEWGASDEIGGSPGSFSTALSTPYTDWLAIDAQPFISREAVLFPIIPRLESGQISLESSDDLMNWDLYQIPATGSISAPLGSDRFYRLRSEN